MKTNHPWNEAFLLKADYLRQLGVKPHYFGLGFIQLKLDEVFRLHFWTPDWPTIPGAETEYHNHRYSFTSKVLKGSLRHELISVDSGSPSQGHSMEMIAVSCKPGGEENPKSKGLVTIQSIGSFCVERGASYTLDRNAFHRAYATKDTVTLLQRTIPVAEDALVLREPGTTFHCPFSIEKTEDECWQRIEQILEYENNPGYHARTIKKGILGDISKIQEELDELNDAHEQDVKIMAILEAADLYGAIRSYLAKYHPGISMEDLEKMCEVTERAFRSGRRIA